MNQYNFKSLVINFSDLFSGAGARNKVLFLFTFLFFILLFLILLLLLSQCFSLKPIVSFSISFSLAEQVPNEIW